MFDFLNVKAALNVKGASPAGIWGSDPRGITGGVPPTAGSSGGCRGLSGPASIWRSNR